MIELIDAYIALRRAAGYKLDETARLLHLFARYATGRGDTHIRTETALQWAALAPSPYARHIRLTVVVKFARYVRVEDPLHELPPADAFPHKWHNRPIPYIYEPHEIRAILAATRDLKPRGSSRADTYRTLLGLLASTGLRVQEALHLRLCDVTADGLVIRETKFRKSRLVPIHETTAKALNAYCRRWRAAASPEEPLFVSTIGTSPSYVTVVTTFLKIVRLLGLRSTAGPRGKPIPGPRIHDFRHTFAVRALEACPAGRLAIERHMLALSTYLGHSHVRHTYWYLQATPQLMDDIANACEAHFEGGAR